jgi:hypothetical protein
MASKLLSENYFLKQQGQGNAKIPQNFHPLQFSYPKPYRKRIADQLIISVVNNVHFIPY